MASTTKDMSKGNPLKVLVLFTLPMILSATFQQLYNVADSVIAGRMVGGSALAAVSASYPITVIFTNLGIGLGVGCSVVTGRLYGKRDWRRLKSAVSTAFISFVCIAAVCSVAGYFGSAPVLRLLSTPAEIFDDSTDYLAIYMLGMVFIFLYNSASATFQSLGNSNVPLFFLIFSTLFNIALDIVFIKVFHLGVMGLSLATVIAQGIACVLSMLVLAYILTNLEDDKAEEARAEVSVGRAAAGDSSENIENLAGNPENSVETPAKNTENSAGIPEGSDGTGEIGSPPKRRRKKRFFVRVGNTFRSCFKYFFGKKPYKKFDRSVLAEVMAIGVPSAIQSSTVSIGQLFIQNLINGNGPAVVAGYGAAIKINTFCISIVSQCSNALSIFVSQNVGAGTPERIKRGMLSALLMQAVLAAVLISITMGFASQLVSIFVDDVGDELVSAAEVVSIGRGMLLILMPFYSVAIFKFVSDATMKGVGYMPGFVTSTGVDLVLRVAFAYILFYATHTYVGIWWSWPIGWVVGAAVAVLFCAFGGWRKRIFSAVPAAGARPGEEPSDQSDKK